MDKNFFIEQLVKKEKSGKDVAIKGLIIFGAVVLTIASFLLGGLAVFIAAAVWFGAWFLLQKTNKEFEYIFTNGDIDVDTIYSKARRKKSFSANVRDFEIVAKVTDQNHAGELKNFEQVLDFSSGTNEKNTFAGIMIYKGKRTKVLFEPKEKILEAMKYYIPRQLKWKKYGY